MDIKILEHQIIIIYTSASRSNMNITINSLHILIMTSVYQQYRNSFQIYFYKNKYVLTKPKPNNPEKVHKITQCTGTLLHNTGI